jgi:hypothetical protein
MHMASSPTERSEHLAAWLDEVVDLLLDQGGAVASALLATCAGRKAVIRLDDTLLLLSAERQGARLRLATDVPPPHVIPDFETNATTLRDILGGQLLLDTAITEDRIRVAAPLAQLLAMHDLVMKALACGPVRPALRFLWEKFDHGWPDEPAPVRSLTRQRPRHGILPNSVPLDVLHVRLAAPDA